MQIVNNWVIEWMSSRLSLTEKEIDFEANVFEVGYLDSLGIFEIISEIEEKFNIALTEEDLFDDRISTLSGIIEIVNARAL